MDNLAHLSEATLSEALIRSPRVLSPDDISTLAGQRKKAEQPGHSRGRGRRDVGNKTTPELCQLIAASEGIPYNYGILKAGNWDRMGPVERVLSKLLNTNPSLFALPPEPTAVSNDLSDHSSLSDLGQDDGEKEQLDEEISNHGDNRDGGNPNGDSDNVAIESGAAIAEEVSTATRFIHNNPDIPTGTAVGAEVYTATPLVENSVAKDNSNLEVQFIFRDAANNFQPSLTLMVHIGFNCEVSPGTTCLPLDSAIVAYAVEVILKKWADMLPVQDDESISVLSNTMNGTVTDYSALQPQAYTFLVGALERCATKCGFRCNPQFGAEYAFGHVVLNEMAGLEDFTTRWSALITPNEDQFIASRVVDAGHVNGSGDLPAFAIRLCAIRRKLHALPTKMTLPAPKKSRKRTDQPTSENKQQQNDAERDIVRGRWGLDETFLAISQSFFDTQKEYKLHKIMEWAEWLYIANTTTRDAEDGPLVIQRQTWHHLLGYQADAWILHVLRCGKIIHDLGGGVDAVLTEHGDVLQAKFSGFSGQGKDLHRRVSPSKLLDVLASLYSVARISLLDVDGGHKKKKARK